MSEAAFGQLEALFVLCGIACLAAIWWVTFRPSARRRMEEHGLIPFRGEEGPAPGPGGGEGRDGHA